MSEIDDLYRRFKEIRSVLILKERAEKLEKCVLTEELLIDIENYLLNMPQVLTHAKEHGQNESDKYFERSNSEEYMSVTPDSVSWSTRRTGDYHLIDETLPNPIRDESQI